MIVEQGRLKGSFKGFKNRDTLFEFAHGKTWRQAEYKYNYHYAYMPEAKVVQDGVECLLYVEGMDEPVRVRRA